MFLLLESIVPRDLMVTPHDIEGTLTLLGPREAVDEAKATIAQFDVQPTKVRLSVRVESSLDHAEWKADLRLTNARRWTGSDEATGTELAIATRRNGDGTLTVFVESKSADTKPCKVVLRLKLGEPAMLGFPLGQGDPVVGVDAAKVRGLRITLTDMG